MGEIETYKPSHALPPAGAAAAFLASLLLSLFFGGLYGFSFAIWKFLGVILFCAAGLMALAAVLGGVRLGRVRNPYFSAALGPVCFIVIAFLGRFIASKLLKIPDTGIPFYNFVFVISLIGSAVAGYYVVAEILMYDEKNRRWYKEKRIGYISGNDSFLLSRILKKEGALGNDENFRFHPAVGNPAKYFIDLKFLISVPGSPVYLRAVEHSGHGDKNQQTKEYEGFIGWEIAQKVEAGCRQAMKQDGAYRSAGIPEKPVIS